MENKKWENSLRNDCNETRFEKLIEQSLLNHLSSHTKSENRVYDENKQYCQFYIICKIKCDNKTPELKENQSFPDCYVRWFE